MQRFGRPIVADEAKTAQFLASRGLTLNNDARALFLDFVLVEFLEALKLLERRAKNDYTSESRICVSLIGASTSALTES